MADKENELGALWEKTTKNGKRMLSGTIDGKRVVCWLTGSDNPKAPKWRVYRDTFEPRSDGQQRTQGAPADDDIGF